MFGSIAVFHDHKDLIHDIAYDFHGTRIATCSSDQSVKVSVSKQLRLERTDRDRFLFQVWDLNDSGQWNCSASWKVGRTYYGSMIRSVGIVGTYGAGSRHGILLIDVANLAPSVQVHSGSVWKVTWAHPEFGQVLATCSFDRTAAVWEEIGKLCRISR